MNIQTVINTLIDAGIESNEAKYEVKMLLEHLGDIISGNINPIKQDHSIATYAYICIFSLAIIAALYGAVMIEKQKEIIEN